MNRDAGNARLLVCMQSNDLIHESEINAHTSVRSGKIGFQA